MLLCNKNACKFQKNKKIACSELGQRHGDMPEKAENSVKQLETEHMERKCNDKVHAIINKLEILHVYLKFACFNIDK